MRTDLPEATLVIYDLSQPVLGAPASYSDDLPQDQWVVISSCAGTATPVVPVGVIPSSGYGGTVEAEARAGDYDELLAECT